MLLHRGCSQMVNPCYPVCKNLCHPRRSIVFCVMTSWDLYQQQPLGMLSTVLLKLLLIACRYVTLHNCTKFQEVLVISRRHSCWWTQYFTAILSSKISLRSCTLILSIQPIYITAVLPASMTAIRILGDLKSLCRIFNCPIRSLYYPWDPKIM